MIVAIGFPDPFGLLGGALHGLARDAVVGPVQDILVDQFQKMFGVLVAWVIDAVVSLSVAILGFFWDAAEPDVGAAWFSGGSSTPYGLMVVMAAPLLAVFFLAGVIQGVVKGDVAGMVRMALLRLPGACLAMVITVAVTDVLLRVTDAMSETVFAGFRDDIEEMSEMMAPLAATPGIAPFAQLLVLIFASVGVLAAMAVLLELFVRAGLIYIVVALSPLIYAAAVWESLRGGVRKMAEIGFALILSKFVIAVALALSAAAMTSMWEASGTEFATPEQAAAGESWAAIVGILLSSIVMFAVSAFMPFVLFKLLPVAEAATVAAGVKSGPLRGAQQAHHVAMMSRRNPAARAMRQGRGGSQMSSRPVRAGNGGGTAASGPGGGGGGGRGSGPGGGRGGPAGRAGPAAGGSSAAGSAGAGAAGGSGAAAGAAGAGTGGAAAGGTGGAGAAAGPVGAAVAGGAAAAKKGVSQARSSAARSADRAGPAGSGSGGGNEGAARPSRPRPQDRRSGRSGGRR